MSDTPRSDAQKRGDFVHINFARELERENAALKAALDHQMTYQRELRADKERLDWLETKGAWMTIPGARNYASGSSRAVIDAAMKEGER